ncbi:sacsin N-terminal ATP-binding-like domain-containing protein [Streptomyces sp. NPDC057072]|uniref:sacsin N-terminal ATP-binding-like domain-containing protein n=1 Tax=Streptomyces sp. NPDC057072 TaxID=3346014 RepID=UPI003628D9DF
MTEPSPSQTFVSSDASPVIAKVLEQSARVLETYRVDPGLVQEHANNEQRITQGGYGDRQLFELVQNGADEIANEPGGKLQVVLTDDYLYCANQGSPVTPEGAETILRMSVSRKRNKQIGRFGVGVKSVLSVSDAPQFFSRTGCFGFDREWSAQEIAGALGVDGIDPAEMPVLRMARPLDEEQEVENDPVLRELRRWATTVVRLPLLPGAAERLGHDMAGHRHADGRTVEGFPAGFQLFSSHVGEVTLEDRRRSPLFRRAIKVTSDGVHRTITEVRTGAKQEVHQWKVYSLEHAPSAQARGSAGELHDRSVIDISWAVPEYTRNKEGLLTVPPGRGEFWSFFPTKYPVSLTGYLNAAWKTNEDRQNLLDGSEFNQELMQTAAHLVIDSLPLLAPAEDPGAYLPLLPGRTNEFINWADDYLLRQVWLIAARRPSLPDQNGVLRIPRDLHIHPKNLDQAWLQIWAEYPGRPRDWVHPSVDATDLRHGKMEHILAVERQKSEDVVTWLEALVADGTPEASCHAIRILSAMVDKDRADRRASDSPLTAEARKARIVLTESHGLVAPVSGKIFHRTDQEQGSEDVYVHRRISSRPEMARHLHTIGIRISDAQGRFEGLLDQGFARYTPDAWTNFWVLMRSAGGNAQVGRIRAKVADPLATIRVRTVSGSFRVMRECLLPGPVVPADGSRDPSVAVDLHFHAADQDVFRELGLHDAPTLGHRPEKEGWFQDYRQAVHDAHLRSLADTAPRPSLARLTVEGAAPAGPLHLLTLLSDEGRAAFLDALPEGGVVESWTRRYGTQPEKPVVSPLLWFLNRHGRVRTAAGIVGLRQAVGPQLKEYARVLPVAEISPEKARRLRMPTTPEDVPDRHWTKLLETVLTSTDDAFIGRAYALLLRVGFGFPEGVQTRCRIGADWGTRPDTEIAVATHEADFRELVREQLPALLIADRADAAAARQMHETWGMLKVADVITKNIRKVAAGRATLLVDEFPPLRQRVGNPALSRKVQRCTELEQTLRTPLGSRLIPMTIARQGSTLLVLDSLTPLEVLEAADSEFGWGLEAKGCRQLIEHQKRQEQNQEIRDRLRRVREAESIIDKIAALIGEEQLRGELPPGLLDSEINEQGGEPDARRIAEMAFNAHGESILRVHRKDLAVDYPGIAPNTFTGDSKALKFVTEHGFPDSFAGARVPALAPRIEVEGPSEFPALHDYQEELARALHGMLDSATPQRAMLTMPTGAGKTRVTSEGVIRWIRQQGTLPGPVLWIAQTEELCEQAVQSWRYVWSKVGAEIPLVISRLWSSNEAAPVYDRPHLVVATDAKLQVCLATEDYAWLRRAALVIVDEAHVAISPRYTTLLELLGLTHNLTSRHLIGLTATPFRNNVELSRRLVQRFGTRLDNPVFDGDQVKAIKQLQELGVLAQVEHEELAGATIQLNADELSRSEQFGGLLPKGAEQRLADDHERNQRIVDRIAAMDADWPVLVFATSVAHAKFLAAKLGDRDVRAAAIDSATPIAERRKTIEDFRKGKIKVLTNYGVLSQGFDAPATRAVVVTRPTYSPNIYQQMIGRGLRGPRNGGKETCLILNVRDNIDNYREELAFTKFDYLWGENQ